MKNELLWCDWTFVTSRAVSTVARAAREPGIDLELGWWCCRHVSPPPPQCASLAEDSLSQSSFAIDGARRVRC